MARGTAAGLLDSEHAQSVHKLAILEQYAPRFVAKTARFTGRVVLVDGYAGTGRMGDAPGSAALLASAAAKLRRHAETTVYLCERSRTNFQQLQEVEAAFKSRGVAVEAFREDVGGASTRLLLAARGATVLWFLDPCGALLPFEQIVRLLKDPARSFRGSRLPTEALLNFSAGLVRRVGGAWIARSEDADGVERLTAVCGGDWWKEMVHELGPSSGADDYGNVVEAVAAEYSQRLARASGTSHVLVPVRDQVGHQPIYHLVFLSGNAHGIGTFLDAAGTAWPEWLAATATENGADELALWANGEVTTSTARENRRNDALRQQSSLVPIIVSNIRSIATVGQEFSLLPNTAAVYRGVEGVATLKQIRAALRQLTACGDLVLGHQHNDPMRRVYTRTS